MLHCYTNRSGRGRILASAGLHHDLHFFRVLDDQCFERACAAANGDVVAFPVIDLEAGIPDEIGGNSKLRVIFLGKAFQTACRVDRVANGRQR